ncbi:MAG: hypothetical protein NVS2B11_05360 [Acetobacteraceae bacterium]
MHRRLSHGLSVEQRKLLDDLEPAVAALRQTEDVPDHLLAHLSPLGWEHVNLTGDYIWAAARDVSENASGLRPPRVAPAPYLRAA